MAALGESGPDANADDPFARLGLSRDAGFDQVQAAKARCLAEVSGDDQARAKIEAAYDAVLMARLRDRQQGQVSAAAATASEREAMAGSMPAPPAQAPMGNVLANLRNKLPDPSQSLSTPPLFRPHFQSLFPLPCSTTLFHFPVPFPFGG